MRAAVKSFAVQSIGTAAPTSSVIKCLDGGCDTGWKWFAAATATVDVAAAAAANTATIAAIATAATQICDALDELGW